LAQEKFTYLSDTEAKLQAAREAGIEIIMIARPPKPQVQSFATISNLMTVVKRLPSH
jgi:precorrin-6x reductase